MKERGNSWRKGDWSHTWLQKKDLWRDTLQELKLTEQKSGNSGRESTVREYKLCDPIFLTSKSTSEEAKHGFKYPSKRMKKEDTGQLSLILPRIVALSLALKDFAGLLSIKSNYVAARHLKYPNGPSAWVTEASPAPRFRTYSMLKNKAPKSIIDNMCLNKLYLYLSETS